MPVRGGISLGAVLTGVVVAFGAMFLLSAVIGGILAATGVDSSDLVSNGTVEASLAVGIVMAVSMFLAYLWGGYTAGRMARGAGPVNGFLVPLVAIIVAVLVGAIVTALGAAANLNVPFMSSRLPVDQDYIVDYGPVAGVIALVAMFLGGILGGGLGSRWHTKLERDAVSRREAEVEAAEAERLRDAEAERRREAETAVRTDRGGAAATTGPDAPATTTDDRDITLDQEESRTRRG